ncbi:hypothetical protein EUGRSUZ_B00146 [Eucalyptus grandis]|uniref:Uncharacterized protein n=2 Tax=Eucalyptus grandis TaxID=71139 RepID=A0ACC3LNA7_EUCGR|nr:hypothetical protein EUGRSUZ_B00146 [Eucalyptus grandis]
MRYPTQRNFVDKRINHTGKNIHGGGREENNQVISEIHSVRNKDGLWRVFSIHGNPSQYNIYFSHCWNRKTSLHCIALELTNVMKFLSHQSTTSHSMLEQYRLLHNCSHQNCAVHLLSS